MPEFVKTLYAKFVDATRRPIERLAAKLTKIWLFGTLFRCQRETLLGAFYEFLHGLIFATMPFWLGALVLTVLILPPNPQPAGWGNWEEWIARYWTSALATFSNGELLVFAISLLSPTLWLTTHEPKGADKLPHRRPVSTIAVVIVIIGAVLFSLLKSGVPANPTIIFSVSVILTGTALALRYMVFVYHGYRLPPVNERVLTKPTDDFMHDVDMHRRAGTSLFVNPNEEFMQSVDSHRGEKP